jgi:predicted nuclease with TOPRIM domain
MLEEKLRKRTERVEQLEKEISDFKEMIKAREDKLSFLNRGTLRTINPINNVVRVLKGGHRNF